MGLDDVLPVFLQKPSINSPDNFKLLTVECGFQLLPQKLSGVLLYPDFNNKILSTAEAGFEAQNLLKFCPEYCSKTQRFIQFSCRMMPKYQQLLCLKFRHHVLKGYILSNIRFNFKSWRIQLTN